MTQAMNLANFANSLDTSGGVPPTQLNSVVPISKGGTNASTAATARTSLGSTTVGDALFTTASSSAARTTLGLVIGSDVPSPTGTGASGTWPINATTASTATIAGNVSGTVAIANGGTGQTTAALAGAALGAIGVGQTWQSFTSTTRALSTTYTNSTGRPILVQLASYGGGVCNLTINGILVSTGNISASQTITATGIVPAGGTYFGVYSNFSFWVELR